MSGAPRNSITALMGRSGLGGGGAKSTTDLAPASFFRYRGARRLKADAKYGTATRDALASPAAGGGDEKDVGAGDEETYVRVGRGTLYWYQ